MSEVSMRSTMKDHYKRRYPGGHWQRIEDGLQAGIPDINFIVPGACREVWVEAKQLDENKIPKRDTTTIKLGLKVEQRLWLEQRQRAGGRVLVVAKIGREWFVFNDSFRELQDGMTLMDMRFRAAHFWTGAFQLDRIT